MRQLTKVEIRKLWQYFYEGKTRLDFELATGIDPKIVDAYIKSYKAQIARGK